MTRPFPEPARFASAADVRDFERVPLKERLPALDLVRLWAHTASSRGDALALRFLPHGLPEDAAQDYSFDALQSQVHAARAALRAAGIHPEDRVALLVPNHPLTVSAMLAVQAEAVAAPINIYLDAKEIASLLEAIGAKLVVADGAIVEGKLQEILSHCRTAPRCMSLAQLHAGEAAAPASNLHDRDRSSEIVAIFHTGGTTGLPKLVPLSGFNIAAMALASAFAYGYLPQDRVFAAMPMFHVGGLLASTLYPLVCGARVVMAGEYGYRGKGTVAATWALAEREEASVLIGPPTVMGQLAQAIPPREKLPRLRLLVNGAAALPAVIGRQLTQALQVPLTEPWGLTEGTLAVTSVPRDGPSRPGSVGVALPYCEVKAVRMDVNGTELGDCAIDEIGVLAIRGPTLFSGYPGLPAERQPWLSEGWLDTGDLGRIDAEGFVWVTGRAKELIKRGGHGIDPGTIEAALHAEPGVALAAAVGRPDAYAGELPMAYVQAKPGFELDPQTLAESAASRLTERAAWPKEIIVLGALPLTSVGKINKQALKLDAAQRTFAKLLDGIEGLPGRYELAVVPDARHGTVVKVRAPALYLAVVRKVLSSFALHSEVIDKESSS